MTMPAAAVPLTGGQDQEIRSGTLGQLVIGGGRLGSWSRRGGRGRTLAPAAWPVSGLRRVLLIGGG